MNDVNSSGVALLLIIPDHVGRIVCYMDEFSVLATLRLREDIVKLCIDPKLKGEYPPQVDKALGLDLFMRSRRIVLSWINCFLHSFLLVLTT
ncbi:hypothetical protein POPTR_017G036501v4 [Populus trichocarpa]|uniref:Uncharacterized protein n=1 Tax=Populus trichocarpa TaxID=3694 RepID=A0ACC0RPP8_POPTR|nr:hypothetical protein POPTR_017G036501v4 [Populus trichocarpa]